MLWIKSFYTTWIVFIAFAPYLNAQEIDVVNKVVKLGPDSVVLQVYKVGTKTPGYCYVHLHENETASLEAGFRMLLKHGGTLLTIRHSAPGTVNRNITFQIDGSKFEVDPNRIFTGDDTVLIQNIKHNHASNTSREKALHAVQMLSKAIWSEVKSYETIVALHNNKNHPASCERKGWFGRQLVPESYNITSYVMKNDSASESSMSANAIYINPGINNSDFFIVTKAEDFDALQKAKMSVVLQNENPLDDGSMSVFAYSQNKRYFNAEAKMGKVDFQFTMLETLHSILTHQRL